MSENNVWQNCPYKPNNIYNVDCYEAIKKIPDKSIDLVYIDIPYDLEDNGGGGCFGTKKRDYHKEYENVSTIKKSSGIHLRTCKNIDGINKIAFGIDYSILEEFERICKSLYIYIWCSKKQIYPLMDYFVGQKQYRFEIFTWHKTNPIPTCNNKYLSDTEYCLMFRADGTKINGTYETKGKYFISQINKNDKDLYLHPTCKPINFVKNHIINSTNENDIVLDCFLGSGTTAVACKELGRRYIGFEIDKNYFEIAQDRLNGISQKQKKEEKKLKENGIQTIFDFIGE